MARAGRLSNKELKRLKSKTKRNTNNRNYRQYYLIVCEGEKTEPNYFLCFEKELPRGVVKIEIIGAGDNTLNVVNIAIEKRNGAEYKYKKNKIHIPYDQVWVVFDRDSFPARDFNDAIIKADQNNINVAYSNEAFEIWYMLHFNYYDSALSRKQYCRKLTECIGEKYQKNDENNYNIMNEKGDQKLAIERAKHLYDKWDHASPAKENPSTTVFKLVEELNQFKK